MTEVHRGYVGPLDWDLSDSAPLDTPQVAIYPLGSRTPLVWNGLTWVGDERVSGTGPTAVRTRTARLIVVGPAVTDAELADAAGLGPIFRFTALGKFANALRVKGPNGWRPIGTGDAITVVT